jgi:predicted methyltransferase
MRLPVIIAGVILAAGCAAGPADRPGAAAAAGDRSGTKTGLFPPEELGLLEDPDRDEWQQPERVMDALGIADGAHVADVGAGGGWFTIRLARRVGPNGVVYAEDIQREMLASINKRVALVGLQNVQTRLGTPSDSNLPTGLTAVLLVDTYSQLRDPINLLRNAAAALGPTGRLGIVEFKKDGAGGPGPPAETRVPPEVVISDAARAGLKLQRQETFLRYQYLLVFGK